ARAWLTKWEDASARVRAAAADRSSAGQQAASLEAHVLLLQAEAKAQELNPTADATALATAYHNLRVAKASHDDANSRAASATPLGAGAPTPARPHAQPRRREQPCGERHAALQRSGQRPDASDVGARRDPRAAPADGARGR